MNGIFVRQQPTVRKENVHIGKRKDFARRVCELEHMTTHRAYEIFERKGRTHGHDLEDWFEAQEELFVQMRGEFIESEFSLEWIAEVGGFHASDLEVHVDPHRLVILGRKMAKGTPCRSEPTVRRDHEKEIYRVVDLPVEVDPVMVTANIQNGVLNVFLLKAGNPLERMSLAAAA
jgi:HSP20 family molecular chaperone IbpA